MSHSRSPLVTFLATLALPLLATRLAAGRAEPLSEMCSRAADAGAPCSWHVVAHEFAMQPLIAADTRHSAGTAEIVRINERHDGLIGPDELAPELTPAERLALARCALGPRLCIVHEYATFHTSPSNLAEVDAAESFALDPTDDFGACVWTAEMNECWDATLSTSQEVVRQYVEAALAASRGLLSMAGRALWLATSLYPPSNEASLEAWIFQEDPAGRLRL